MPSWFPQIVCVFGAFACTAEVPPAADAPPRPVLSQAETARQVEEAPRPAATSAAPTVRRSVDLLARIDAFTAQRPDATDGEFYVYRSPAATVHMHVIGVGQMCPLHIHRTTHEATVIVRGDPEVVHVYGNSGTLQQQTRRVPPGHLVYSPPLCGHQWTNVDDVPQGNLVIASPKFDGNLYLHPDDPRMGPGPPPLVLDVDQVLTDTPRTTRTPLDVRPDELQLAIVHDTLTVHTDPTRDTVLYVARGTGQLAGQPLRPGIALVLQGGDPEELVAESPLAVWMFTPRSQVPAQ